MSAIDTDRTAPSPLRALMVFYPRAWRERYEAEFVEMLDTERVTFALLLDVLFGAVDARVRPQAVVDSRARGGATDQGGVMSTTTPALKWRCVGSGSNVTRRDQWMGAAVMLGVTLTLSIVYVWLHVRFGDNTFIDAFGLIPIFAGMILSLPFSYLKGRPRISQAVFIAVSLLLLVAFFAVVGAIAARL